MARVKLNEIAVDVRETYKGSQKDIPIVGLEHITPEDINLALWDTNVENTFTKHFCKGDVLFGRRRAYLKKAALAPFDGICSGDITVIRAKDGVLDPSLLPFIIQNDQLFDFAVSQSAGSLSPRVKWEHLGQYELSIPSLEEQKKLAESLWAIEETLQAYKKLLVETDNMVKSQFIEMFGSQNDNPLGLPVMTLRTVCKFYSGTGFPNDYQGNTSGHYPFFKVGDISRNVQAGNKWLQESDNYIEQDVADKLHGTILPKGTVVFAKIGEALRLNRRAITSCDCLIDNNVMGIQPNEEYLDTEYFFNYMLQLDLGKYAGATAMPSVRKSTLEELTIIIPSVEQQKTFASLSKQSDKSRLALKDSIAALQDTKKSIMRDAFGC